MITTLSEKLSSFASMIRTLSPKLRGSWHAAAAAVGGRQKRPGAAAAVAIGLVATLAAGCSTGAEGDDQTAGQVVQFAKDKRVAAPELKGELIQGGSFDLASHKGKVVVLNFWASWCAPCRLEVADLEKVHKELTDVAFVGLNTYDDKDKALAFMDGKATYPSVLDTSGKLALAFRQVPPNTLPATIILDADGKIAAVIRRTTTEAELKDLVTAVAAEKG